MTVETGNPEADKLTGYPLFDWLRFALASVVVLDHAGLGFPEHMGGGLAVEVFFALSGWLIGGILLKTARDEVPRFFFNRATRIWIPYAVAITLLYGVAFAKDGADYFWFKYLFLDLTFTHQLFTAFPAALSEMPLDGSGNQFWSISVEEQFYLLAPLIMIFARRGRSLLVWIPIALVTMALQLHVAAISLGVCAAIIEARGKYFSKPNVSWVAAAFAAACAAGMFLTGERAGIAPLFAVAVVVAAARPGARDPLAQVAGGLSYPLYLNHWIGVFAVNFVSKRYVTIGHVEFLTAQYAVNVGIALAMYLTIDRQIQLHRHGWYSEMLGRRLTATSYGLVAIGLVVGSSMQRFGPTGI